MITYHELFDLDDGSLIERDEHSESLYRLAKKQSSRLDSTPTNETLFQPPTTSSHHISINDPEPSKIPIPEKNPNDNQLVVRENVSVPEESQLTFVDWKLHRVMVNAHLGWIRCCTIDPVSNQWFVSGSADTTIKIWDLASLELKATLTGHIMAVRAVAVSKKFPYLFSGSEDKTVRCWDLERTNSPSGCQIRDYYGHVGGIYAMDLHPELDVLFTAGRDSAVRVWDIRSRTEIMVLAGHRGEVTSVNCHSFDPQVVTSSMDNTIRLWDIRKASTQLTITHHTKSIRLMVSHPREMTMCSADSLGSFKQWVLPRGELLDEWKTTKQENTIVNSLAINAVDNTLFAGYDDGSMEFYGYKDGQLLQKLQTPAAPGSNGSTIFASTFDHLGSRLITCESDKAIKIWSPSEP